MTHEVLTKPNYLEYCVYWKVVSGRKVWKSTDGTRLYTWDELHGEIEVFNARGKHLGSADKITGEIIKDAVRGRKLYV
ncbi:membrane protein [Desulfosporosinus sp. HMP52]|uniref:colicin E3/pyocin S6 family cytotoxin n=1 Tax=Desulfosporosinus sp. HMP52 TaxID=1487923 RepID=UPI00051FBB2A|nr:colicin E3/pyocin S6 family cytotoxin [Desulfosporosinus sp. HMP52]KGK89375.1 membrane protein [Desulfosporosinus sp. HMP52]